MLLALNCIHRLMPNPFILPLSSHLPPLLHSLFLSVFPLPLLSSCSPTRVAFSQTTSLCNLFFTTLFSLSASSVASGDKNAFDLTSKTHEHVIYIGLQQWIDDNWYFISWGFDAWHGEPPLTSLAVKVVNKTFLLWFWHFQIPFSQTSCDNSKQAIKCVCHS